MKQRLSLALSSIICCASIYSQSVTAETLLDIYQQAQQNDHLFQSAKANLAAGLEDETINRAALLPQISAGAEYAESRKTNKITDSDQDGRNQGYSINLNQNLINFRAWNTSSQGKALADLARAQYLKDQQDLILRTARAYFDALKAVDNLASANAEKESYSHQLEQTKQRFEVGLTAITEVHEAQARYDSGVANQLIAEGGLGIAFEALEVITGQSYTGLSPLKEGFPVEPPTPAQREPWEEEALKYNVDLKLAEHQRESADALAKAAKSEHYPVVTGALSYGNQRQDQFQNPAFDTESEGFTVGVNLQVPIFAGGGISATRRKAASQALSVKELYFQTRRAVVQTTRASHLRVITAAATVDARKQAILSNQSALEATQAGYDVGTRDLVDVLNAQRLLYIAQRDYFDALYAYVLATLELKQAAGTLTENDVVELNSWLDRSHSVGPGKA